jgi:hypothetical protein
MSECQAAMARSLPQCKHLMASTARSACLQYGHALVGAGSPKTVWPRLRM